MAFVEGIQKRATRVPVAPPPRDVGANSGPQPPKLGLWLAWPAIVVLMVADQLLPQRSIPCLRAAGLVALALAVVFVVPPFFLLWKRGQAMDGRGSMRGGTVVDTGLYGLVRHPQYLGFMCLACGFALLYPHWLIFALAAFAAVSLWFQARQEERYCCVELGAAYEEYARRVPRFNIVLGIARHVRRGRNLGSRG